MATRRRGEIIQVQLDGPRLDLLSKETGLFGGLPLAQIMRFEAQNVEEIAQAGFDPWLGCCSAFVPTCSRIRSRHRRGKLQGDAQVFLELVDPAPNALFFEDRHVA